MKRINLRGRSRRAKWIALGMVVFSAAGLASVAGHAGWQHYYGPPAYYVYQPAPVPVIYDFPVYVPYVPAVVVAPVPVVVAPAPVVVAPAPFVQHNHTQNNSANVTTNVDVNNATMLNLPSGYGAYANCGCAWELWPGIDLVVNQTAQVGVDVAIQQD